MAKSLPVKFPTEESGKKALKINSFRELSKDKVMQFASMIPYMDKEVALAIINQFPTYADYVQSVISFYSDIGNRLIESNNESQNAVIRGYQTTLDALSMRMEKADSEEVRKAVTQDMINVADKMAEFDYNNKKFILKFLSKAGLVFLGAVAVVGAAIGINSAIGQNGDLPQLEEGDNDEENEEDTETAQDEL